MSLLAQPCWHLNPGAWIPHSFLLNRGLCEVLEGASGEVSWRRAEARVVKSALVPTDILGRGARRKELMPHTQEGRGRG